MITYVNFVILQTSIKRTFRDIKLNFIYQKMKKFYEEAKFNSLNIEYFSFICWSVFTCRLLIVPFQFKLLEQNTKKLFLVTIIVIHNYGIKWIWEGSIMELTLDFEYFTSIMDKLWKEKVTRNICYFSKLRHW